MAERMPHSIALIQLISEQTVQNLLPAILLNPKLIIHLITPKTTKRAQDLIQAIRALAIECEHETVPLTAMPTINEVLGATSKVSRQAKQRGCEPVINFTGGTKLMSIGAYLAAAYDSWNSAYVDTDRCQLISGETGKPDLVAQLFGRTRWDNAIRKLRVDIIAIANGCERVTNGRSWEDYRALARLLLEHPDLEEHCYSVAKNLKGGPLRLPEKVANLLKDLELVQATSKGYVVSEGKSPRFSSAQERYEILARLLNGGWWEIAVLDSAERFGKFRDLRWSVRVGPREATTDMEEDVLGMDGPNLVYISCKRSGVREKLGPLLDEIRSRAERIGGRFARKYLAIFRDDAISPDRMRDLQERASLMGIQIIGRKEVLDGSAWSKK